MSQVSEPSTCEQGSLQLMVQAEVPEQWLETSLKIVKEIQSNNQNHNSTTSQIENLEGGIFSNFRRSWNVPWLNRHKIEKFALFKRTSLRLCSEIQIFLRINLGEVFRTHIICENSPMTSTLPETKFYVQNAMMEYFVIIILCYYFLNTAVLFSNNRF